MRDLVFSQSGRSKVALKDSNRKGSRMDRIIKWLRTLSARIFLLVFVMLTISSASLFFVSNRQFDAFFERGIRGAHNLIPVVATAALTLPSEQQEEFVQGFSHPVRQYRLQDRPSALASDVKLAIADKEQ